jgi:hypothetical protein
MDDLEGKLNSLLSSPESMERIMQLAKSLSGEQGGAEAAKAAPDPRLLGLITKAAGEFSAPGETERLAEALRPFLSPERAERLERAARIARIARVARSVIPELGGGRGLV